MKNTFDTFSPLIYDGLLLLPPHHSLFLTEDLSELVVAALVDKHTVNTL
jgi:hypothetical protein